MRWSIPLSWLHRGSAAEPLRPPPPRPLLRAAGVWAAAAAATAVLLATSCGGGGVDIGGTGATITGQAYTTGPIEGFGSIIVNGVHYDDSGARVEDGDGNPRPASELALGMVVEIDSGPVDTSGAVPTARATRIRTGGELVGRVEAVDAAAGTLRLLGQRVALAADTVVDARIAGGTSGLAAGQVLEVHALYDAAAGVYRATRVAPAVAGAPFRLRGPVGAIDAAARTLSVGGTVYALGTAVSADVAPGGWARVRLDDGPDARGRWTVAGFGTPPAPPTERERAEVEGIVERVGTDGTLRVEGVTVDIRAAALPDGAAGVRAGARVAVTGALRGGVLVAAEVRIRNRDGGGGSSGGGSGGGNDDGPRRYDLTGPVAALDATARTFVLRGVTVQYGAAGVRFSGGTAADLANGRTVEVRGRLGADRTQLVAEEIRLR